MKKQLLILVAAILAMASSTPTWAYDFYAVAPSGQTLYYNIVDSHAEVVRLESFYVTGNLVIPASVTYNGTTYPVTALATISNYGSFESCGGLTSVIIPNSVTTIGDGAFRNCFGLTSVTIGNSVTSIGNYAFYNCSGLTSVTIPNSVTSIGGYAFFGCTGLTSVTIPNSVTSIGSSAFSIVRHIEYYGSASGSPWGARSMNGVLDGDFVYSDTTKHHLIRYVGNVGNVTVPNSVTLIDSSAFSGCFGLTSVTIPNSVTTIGDNAFYDCFGLTSTIYTGTIAQWCNISFGGLANPLFYSHSLTIGGTEITNLVIPNGVTEIKQNAFQYCTSLTSVTIPNSVTSIGSSAFSDCSGLTSVTIPNSVTSIGRSAFSCCSGLTSVTIPNSVTSIGIDAFHNCTGLTSVAFNADSCTSSYYAPFYNCTNITNFSFDDNVKVIPGYLCVGLTGLTSVTIPNSVTSIGISAFYGCSGLTSFTIGSGVTSIGACALGGCTGLRNIISKAVYPPTASDNTFENVPPSCKLTVPCGSLQYYQVTPLWNTQFPLMEEDCNPVGIDDTENEDVMVYAANGMIYISSTLPTETTIFDITGHQVATFTAEAASVPLPAGVYLVKIGAYPARKVVVIR